MTPIDYMNVYRQYLELVQKHEKKCEPVHLIFAPLGSNVMFLANQLHHNLRQGRRTVITQGNYGFDRKYMRRHNRTQGTRHQLDPWVLQRYDDHFGHKRPWEIWFRNLNENEAESRDYHRDRQQLLERLSLAGETADKTLLEHAICLAYAIRFNQATLKFIRPHNQVTGKKTAAVHIRRGDACTEDLSIADRNRDHHSLESYLYHMQKLAGCGYTDFYILTESQVEIDRLQAESGSQFNILFHHMDRSRFIRISSCKHDPANYVEYRCLEDPGFTKMLVESALIDIYNAANCQALIGTFSSQFSALNYLNIVAGAQGVARCVNLSGVPYTRYFGPRHLPDSQRASARLKRQLDQRLRKLSIRRVLRRRAKRKKYLACLDSGETHLPEQFDSIYAENGRHACLVIRERDVGFFSLFLQVVNTLLCVEYEHLKCDVLIDFGNKQLYYKGRNTWLDFFGQPGEESLPDETKLLEAVDRSYTENTWQMQHWENFGTVYKARDGLYWTGSYYPKFTEASTSWHIDHAHVPSPEDRRRSAAVIDKHIRMRPELLQEVDDFVQLWFAGRHVIGVQFRGTDARKDSRREVPTYESYFHRLEPLLHRQEPGSWVIFVASDEKAFVDAMKDRFQSVVSIDTIRHDEGEEVQTRGGNDWGMPGFITKDSDSALKGALLDYLILCRVHVMVHNLGSLTNAALMTNPDIESILIGRAYA